MKKTYIGFAGLSLLLLLGTQTVHAQQGFGTDKPHRSAAVDIQSSKRGLLIPRVDLTSIKDVVTIDKPAQSLMVYNQATTTGMDLVTPGYYYWDTDRWVRFAQQGDITAINLAGDVTGSTNATVVGAIQGVEVSNVNPTANQVLTFDSTEGKWKPISLTETNLTSSKGITGTGITVGGTDKGAGSVLKDVTLSITHGGANQVMVTNADGSGTTWVDQSTIAPATTNELIKKNSGDGENQATDQNTIVSTVNGIPAEVKVIDNITNTITDSSIVTTVNGVSSISVDLTPAIQAGQKTTSVKNGSEKVSVVTTGTGTTGKNTEYTVDVVEAKLNLQNIGGQVTNNQIQGAEEGDVLVSTVDDKGNKITKWVKQIDIVPATTNELTKKTTGEGADQNMIVSTVNGKSAEVKVIDSVTNTITDSFIVTTVNGVPSTSVDLTPAIQAGQKTVEVVKGTNTTVTKTPETGDSKHTTYAVNVSNDAILAAQKLTTVSQGTGVKVTPITPSGSNTTDYNVAINTDGSTVGDVLTVVKDGDTATKIEWTKPVEQKNIYTHDGTLLANRTVDFGENETLKFQKKATDFTQVAEFNLSNVHTALNMSGKDGAMIHLHGSNGGGEGKLTIAQSSNSSEINSKAKNGLRLVTEYEKNIVFETYHYPNDGSNSVKLENVVVQGNGGLRINRIHESQFNGTTTDKVVVADVDGVLKTVDRKKVAPQFFYMPAVIFNTKTKGTGLTRDLYQDYVNQFTATKGTAYNIAHGANGGSLPYDGGVIGSTGAPAVMDTFARGELHYYVTYYDKNVFANISINENGVLKYDIIGTATPASYMNIVFVIK
ncbi:hypothetical protein HX017_09225 [Myroides marinus]|uniref:hypothetical protein n=1 Tax=Myroides marinus TaxID=703342 RepID=UPI0025754FAF|nr:hypothetical protein [Myroides marinus]MDM1346808.1 hypothetical protein [Myroides marinus]MDM1350485.1 hypothetical protein [Myroides marinus]MDM1357692.1 hypothetical protein [Myroides marinus]MDM1365127.1 hypothetical protein [Myroides marinus]MDM1368696.1 hypothetical protein [Myroides marinus]